MVFSNNPLTHSGGLVTLGDDLGETGSIAGAVIDMVGLLGGVVYALSFYMAATRPSWIVALS